MRERLVNWLRERVPPNRWNQIWWQAPAMTLLLLPVGLPLIWLLEILGWDNDGRASQGLALLAVTSGPVVGLVVLWSAKHAQLDPHNLRLSLWLARLAVVGPFLTILALVWLARAT